MTNLVLGWQVTPRLKLHTHVLFEGIQTSYNTDLENYIQSYVSYYRYMMYKEMNMENEAAGAWKEAVASANEVTMHKKIPARAITNLGGEYSFGTITLGFDIHNLFNLLYYRSGMNTNVIPQQGRWFMGTVGVRL